MSKLTPWYDGSQKPVRKGVYKVDHSFLPYSYWDGKEWRLGGISPEEAMEDAGCAASLQDMRWRGLAQKPRAGK